MPKNFSITILILLQLIMSPVLAADVYKWIDENGNVVYGDKPVSKKDAGKVKIKQTAGQEAFSKERYEKRQRLLDVLEEERDEKITAAQENKKKQAKQKETCARLKTELTRLKQAGVLYKKTDDPKNPKIFTEEEKQAEEEKYRNYLDKNC